LSHTSEPVVLVASAEFILKSSPVRRTLEQRLIDDLRIALTRAGFDGFRVEKNAARLVVRGLPQSSQAALSCSRVFGVAYAAPALLVPALMQDVMKTIVDFAEGGLQTGQSFAIRSHRSEPGPLSRRDIELKGGSEVLEVLKSRGVRVGLKQPDVTLYVDLVGDRAYVYRERFQGPGGLPLSSQWKMLAVLDSGALTILAAYAMMRRGCLVELFVPMSNNIPSFASDNQLSLARKLRELVTRPNFRIFTVEFEQLLEEGTRGRQMRLVDSKRLVRLAARGLAKEKRFRGMILADVAGEISRMRRQDSMEDGPPVFHPLIGLARNDLSEMCRLTGIVEEEVLRQVKSELEESGSLDLALRLPKDLSEVPIQQVSL
jgi:thiamine biosynthesis protein ThiI